jgi:hypothetical protein
MSGGQQMNLPILVSLLFAASIASPALSLQPKQTNGEVSPKDVKAIVIIGRLKDFGTRNWRPSVYVDEIELARSQNGRFLVAKVDPGTRTIRAEDPKFALQMALKAGECYYFRVEIASGAFKAHGRIVGLSREEGALELKQLTPIEASYVTDSSRVLGAEQAATAATGCAGAPASTTLPSAKP